MLHSYPPRSALGRPRTSQPKSFELEQVGTTRSGCESSNSWESAAVSVGRGGPCGALRGRRVCGGREGAGESGSPGLSWSRGEQVERARAVLPLPIAVWEGLC